MDWLQFLASVISSLAWPTTVVVLVCLLKAPLAKAIPLIRSLKWKDFHIDLTQQIQEAKDEVVSSGTDAPIPDAPVSFKSLAMTDPRAAVLSAWLPVEAELNETATQLGMVARLGSPKMMYDLIDALGKRGILDPSTAGTLLKLRKIRNSAVHADGEEVTYNDALSMGEMCQWALNQLKQINTKL